MTPEFFRITFELVTC